MTRTWVTLISVSWYLAMASTESTHAGISGLWTVSSCICIGYDAVYLCTAIGSGATRWGGTAFDCPYSGNQFSLIHEQYSLPNGTTKYCNEGAIIGWSVQVHGNGYSSMLLVNVTLELNDTTVKCEYIDLSSYQEGFIGEKHIILTAAPFPPPDDIHLVTVTPRSLKFQWSAVASTCASLLYEINTDCGICIAVTNLTDVSCSINVHDSPKVCSFQVRSIVCGNIAGMWSNPVNITLKVPEPLIIIAIQAHYTSDGNLKAVMIEFRGSDRDMFNISRGVDGSIQNYSIVYADAVTMHTCNSVISTNLTSSAPSSCFSLNNNISVSLSAINGLGEGPKTNITIASKADYYVRLLTSSEKIICQFLDKQKFFSTKLCNISYGECHDKEKWRTQWDYTTTESPFNVNLTLKTDPDLRDYCYEVSGTIDNFTIFLSGTHDHTNSGEQSNSVHLVIFAIIGSVIIIVTLACVVYWLCKRNTIKAHVVFELKDCPQEIGKALKILEEQAINIVETKIGGLHTQKCTRKIYLRFERDLTADKEQSIRDQIKQLVPPDKINIEMYRSTKAFNIVTDCYHSLEDTTAVGDSIKSSNNSTTETGAVIEEHHEASYVRILPSKSGALLSLLEGIWSLQNGPYCDINIRGIAEIPITVCNKRFGHIIKINFSINGKFPRGWKSDFNSVKVP